MDCYSPTCLVCIGACGEFQCVAGLITFGGYLDASEGPKNAGLTCLVAFEAIILVILRVVMQFVFAAELYLVDTLSFDVSLPYKIGC